MSLIVEDGTGKADAESYVSVADANTYFTARGVTAWTGSDTVKEQALRKATDYMQAMFSTKWRGLRVHSIQALDWPRYGIVRDPFYIDAETIPAEVIRACAELALRSLGEDLMPDLDPQVASEGLGPIRTDYAIGARRTKTFVAVEELLKVYFIGGGSGVPMVRA